MLMIAAFGMVPITADEVIASPPQLNISMSTNVFSEDDIATVTVKLANGDGLAGIQFDLQYDTEIFEYVADSAQVNTKVKSMSFGDNFINVNSVTGVVRFISVCSSDYIGTGYSGISSVLTLKFKALAAKDYSATITGTGKTSAAGDPFTFSNEIVGNISAESVELASASINVTVLASVGGSGVTSQIPDDKREVTVTFYTPGTTTEVASATAQFGVAFSVEVDPGTYDIAYSSPSFLTVKQADVEVEDGTTLTMPTLTVGDVNGDKTIDIQDLNILLNNFNQIKTDLTDLNNDGTIDIQDLNILLNNFNQKEN